MRLPQIAISGEYAHCYTPAMDAADITHVRVKAVNPAADSWSRITVEVLVKGVLGEAGVVRQVSAGELRCRWADLATHGAAAQAKAQAKREAAAARAKQHHDQAENLRARLLRLGISSDKAWVWSTDQHTRMELKAADHLALEIVEALEAYRATRSGDALADTLEL